MDAKINGDCRLLAGSWIITIVLVSAFLGTSACLAGQNSDQSFLDPESILEGWLSAYGDITNMRVAYTERVIDTKVPDDNPHLLDSLVKVEHVQRIEQGKRFHIRYSRAEDGFVGSDKYQENSFDGKVSKEYFLESGRMTGSISAGLTGRTTETMNILRTYMMLTQETVRLSDGKSEQKPRFQKLMQWAVNAGLVSVEPRLENIAGEPCHVVTIMDLIDKTQIYYKIWIAHDKGMFPMKRQRFSKGRMRVEVGVEKLAKAAPDTDIWYPQKAYRIINNVGQGTQTTYALEGRQFVPNVDVDDATFDVVFPAGAWVYDRIAGISYTVGGERTLDQVNRTEGPAQNALDNRTADANTPPINNKSARQTQPATAEESPPDTNEQVYDSAKRGRSSGYLPKLLAAAGALLVVCAVIALLRRRV